MRIEPLPRLLPVAAFARTGVLNRVQCAVDLRQEALDLIALVRAGTFLQALQQLLLSRQQFCHRGHVLKPVDEFLSRLGWQIAPFFPMRWRSIWATASEKSRDQP
jgi:hypothetical protein